MPCLTVDDVEESADGLCVVIRKCDELGPSVGAGEAQQHLNETLFSSSIKLAQLRNRNTPDYVWPFDPGLL